MLTNIILSQAARSAWAKEPSDQFINASRRRTGTKKRRSNRKSVRKRPAERFRPSDLEAFVRFRRAGIAPKIVSCELAMTHAGGTDTNLPAGARIELWVNCEAVGMFRYPHVAVAFAPDGNITSIAAAELLPGKHDSCFLGRFDNGIHSNYGSFEDWRDQDTFFRAAVPLLVSTLD